MCRDEPLAQFPPATEVPSVSEARTCSLQHGVAEGCAGPHAEVKSLAECSRHGRFAQTNLP